MNSSSIARAYPLVMQWIRCRYDTLLRCPDTGQGALAVSARQESRRNQQGIALLLVLWVITLLSVICAEFAWTMRTETTVTRNFKEGEQAYYTAEAGINKAIVELMRSQNTSKPKAARFGEKPEESEEEEELSTWEPGMGAYQFAFGDHQGEVTISDENNKVNINAFLREAKANPTKLKQLLETKIGMEGEARDIAADSMIDWWDTDHDITGVNGAEDDYYRSLEDPYECRNGDLPVIEELLLIRGIDETIYYGDAGNPDKTTLPSPEELAELNPDERSQKQQETKQPPPEKNAWGTQKINLGLFNIFTIYSSSRDFKLDINTASADQLLLLEGMDRKTAREIISARKDRKFAALTDRLPELKNYEVWKKDITLRTSRESNFYRITARGIEGDGTISRTITCVVMVSKRNFYILQWREGS